MRHLTRTLPLLLAALLQLLPLLRNIVTSPAASSSFAIILRWGIGAGAALGAYDARSAASVSFVSPTNNFSGTVSTFFTNNVVVTNNQEGTGAYFLISNGTNITGPILNGATNSTYLPPGLTLKCVDLNNGSTPVKPLYAAIYGTPTSPVTNFHVIILASYPGYGFITNHSFFTILPAGSGTAPTITNHPAGVTNVAGSSPAFSVTAGGTAPLKYQWRLAASSLAGATNATLALTNILSSQAGNYTVVITNASGAITSSVAVLTITNPLPVKLTATATQTPGAFKFSFTPATGLTNRVEATYSLNPIVWTLVTNIPPQPSATPITITDPLNPSNRYYRTYPVTF